MTQGSTHVRVACEVCGVHIGVNVTIKRCMNHAIEETCLQCARVFYIPLRDPARSFDERQCELVYQEREHVLSNERRFRKAAEDQIGRLQATIDELTEGLRGIDRLPEP